MLKESILSFSAILYRSRTCFLAAFIFASLFLQLAQDACAGDLLNQVTQGQAGISEVGQVFGANGENRDIRAIVAAYVKIFLGFLGLIFIIIIIVAGFKWMTSQGDSNKVEDARKQLQHGVIGLLIVLAAWGIALFAIRAISIATSGA